MAMNLADALHDLARVTLGVALCAGALGSTLAVAQPQPGGTLQPHPGDVSPINKLVEASCAACHGVDGNSSAPQFPKIAGQNADYIAEQLRAFKDGTRKSDVMSAPVSGLTDVQITELARYFSEKKVIPDTVQNAHLASVGARIFRQATATPPCAACHGGNGGPGFGPGGMMGGHMGGRMGMMMGTTGPVPNLFGQHAAYTVQQLDAFASGTRPGTVMGPIAARLDKQDRRAVAEYLSGLR
jgi:cytochrome c553